MEINQKLKNQKSTSALFSSNPGAAWTCPRRWAGSGGIGRSWEKGFSVALLSRAAQMQGIQRAVP
jgi:hypothetical protein